MAISRLFVFALVVCLTVFGPGTGSAAETGQTVVMAAVRQFVDSFNKGDEKGMIAACASPASIVDDFPPHNWHGPTACADWLHAYDADAAKNGIAGGVVTMGTPWHVDVTGAWAYVVVPARYVYTRHGKTVVESGSVFTVVLQKAAAGWRIAAWTWAQH